VNNPSNDYKVSLDKASQYVYIDFDYLDKNQGAVIQAIHTGTESRNIVVTGDIKGVQKLIEISPDQLTVGIAFSATQKRNLWSMALVAFIGLYFVNFQKDIFESLRNSDNLILWFVGLLISSLVLLAIGLLIIASTAFLNRLFRPSRIIPKGLEKFND